MGLIWHLKEKQNSPMQEDNGLVGKKGGVGKAQGFAQALRTGLREAENSIQQQDRNPTLWKRYRPMRVVGAPADEHGGDPLRRHQEKEAGGECIFVRFCFRSLSSILLVVYYVVCMCGSGGLTRLLRWGVVDEEAEACTEYMDAGNLKVIWRSRTSGCSSTLVVR